MNAYLIDPEARTVTQVEYTGEFTNIYQHIEADLFDVARCYQNGDGIFVDDEGLYRDRQFFFLHRNYPSPLAGKGLMLGVDAEGESIAPKTSIEQVREDIVFLTRDELIAMLEQEPAPF